ncbi:chlorohydrolase [Streptococcus pneumoniae]|nr:chlorohydrolase [Streptococcus pneumoniae]
MKIKEQTRKVAGCSKYSFEIADKTDEVSSKHCFEVADIEVADRTEVSNTHLRQSESEVV